MGDTVKGAVANFLATECSGFVNETARAFLRRHANAESLLSQLNALFLQGNHQTCKDLIQLICEEQHPLSASAELFVLRGKVALEENGDFKEVQIWLTQARLNNAESKELQAMDTLMSCLKDLRDGIYQQGAEGLLQLTDHPYVGFLAGFYLGRHLLWKSQNVPLAIFYLENALETKPALKNAWEALGFAFNRDGQKAEAQAAFGKCIELETDPQKLSFYRQQLAS